MKLLQAQGLGLMLALQLSDHLATHNRVAITDMTEAESGCITTHDRL